MTIYMLEGYTAYQMNIRRESNPYCYDYDGKRAVEWWRGWMKAFHDLGEKEFKWIAISFN